MTAEAIKREASEIAQEPNVSVVLFGSRARGTNDDESDWDIAVIVPGKGCNGPTERERKLEAIEGVNAIWIGEEEIKKNINKGHTLEAQIAREGITVAGPWTNPTHRTKGLRVSWAGIGEMLRTADDWREMVAHTLYAQGGTQARKDAQKGIAEFAAAVVVSEGIVAKGRKKVEVLVQQLQEENLKGGRNARRCAQWAQRIEEISSAEGVTQTTRKWVSADEQWMDEISERSKRAMQMVQTRRNGKEYARGMMGQKNQACGALEPRKVRRGSKRV